MKCKQQIIFKANQSSSPYFVGDTILNLGQNPSNSDQTSKKLQVYIGFLMFFAITISWPILNGRLQKTMLLIYPHLFMAAK